MQCIKDDGEGETASFCSLHAMPHCEMKGIRKVRDACIALDLSRGPKVTSLIAIDIRRGIKPRLSYPLRLHRRSKAWIQIPANS